MSPFTGAPPVPVVVVVVAPPVPVVVVVVAPPVPVVVVVAAPPVPALVVVVAPPVPALVVDAVPPVPELVAVVLLEPVVVPLVEPVPELVSPLPSGPELVEVHVADATQRRPPSAAASSALLGPEVVSSKLDMTQRYHSPRAEPRTGRAAVRCPCIGSASRIPRRAFVRGATAALAVCTVQGKGSRGSRSRAPAAKPPRRPRVPTIDSALTQENPADEEPLRDPRRAQRGRRAALRLRRRPAPVNAARGPRRHRGEAREPRRRRDAAGAAAAAAAPPRRLPAPAMPAAAMPAAATTARPPPAPAAAPAAKPAEAQEGPGAKKTADQRLLRRGHLRLRQGRAS